MYKTPRAGSAGDSKLKTHAAGSRYRNRSKQSVSMLGLGMVIGAAIGAGVALLAAPYSGEETRNRIRHRVRHIRGSDRVWDKLGLELKGATALRKTREIERRKEETRKALDRQRAERDARVPPP